MKCPNCNSTKTRATGNPSIYLPNPNTNKSIQDTKSMYSLDTTTYAEMTCDNCQTEFVITGTIDWEQPTN